MRKNHLIILYKIIKKVFFIKIFVGICNISIKEKLIWGVSVDLLFSSEMDIEISVL